MSVKKQPYGLLQVLKDFIAPMGDREDAARDLELYFEPEVEAALFSIGIDQKVDSGLADSVGESLAGIWCRKGKVNKEDLEKLHPAAKMIACAIISRLRPELLSEIS